MTATVRTQENLEIRTYKYRWMIVTFFAILYGLTIFQNNQFTNIENVLTRYYGTTHTLVNLTSLVFGSTMIVLIIPAVYVFAKYNLKLIVVVCAGLTCLGNLLKLVALSPDKFYLIIIAQFICSIAQVSLLALPAKVVAIWCPANEQNRACGMILWGPAIGATISGTLPILLVKDAKTDYEIYQKLSLLLTGNAGFSCLLFIALIFFFRCKPPTPPSVQQSALANQKTNHKQELTQLWNNKEFLKVLFLVTLIIALPFTITMNLNVLYLNAFPNGMGDIPTINLISSAFGSIVGTYIMGSLLDWSHKYKSLSTGTTLCMAMSYGIAAVFMLWKIRIGAMVGLCLFSCLSHSAINLGYQYIAEVSYPVSEFTTLAALYFLSSILIVAVGQIFNILVNGSYFAAIHFTVFAILIGEFSFTFFLSPKLKRMLGNQKDVEIET